MYINRYIYIYVCICIHLHSDVDETRHIYTHTHIYTCIYVYIYMYIVTLGKHAKTYSSFKRQEIEGYPLKNNTQIPLVP